MSSRSLPLRVVTECLQPDGGGSLASARRHNLRRWDLPLRFANEHLLAPAMYASLAASHRLSSLPEEVRHYLEFLHSKNRERNAALRIQAIELFRALQSGGVPAMALKGALALFLNHYVDRGARLFRDLDVLVPVDMMPKAAAILEELGYRAETRYWPIQHAYAEFTRKNDPGAVDLHVELIDASYILPVDEVWQRSQEVVEKEIRLFVPSPTDRVVHNILHSQIHYLGNFYRGELELRQVYDFALLARRYTEEIDWSAIERRFDHHRLQTALQSYTLAATTLFGLSWPLSRPPSLAARFHFRRCLVQLLVPALAQIALPWGNVRSAFAWHRMMALHGDVSRFSVARQACHAIGFLRKSDAKELLARLLKMS